MRKEDQGWYRKSNKGSEFAANYGGTTPYEDWATEKVEEVAPLGRWQTCEDVANLAVFLASVRANNITGQTLNVDGGWIMA